MKYRNPIFAPADSIKKITKAIESIADFIIIDLEDSVSIDNKETARNIAFDTISNMADKSRMVVRINPQDTPFYKPDLEKIIKAKPAAIILPKCTSKYDLQILDNDVSRIEAENNITHGLIGVMPLASETAASYYGIDYRQSTSRLKAIIFGAEDLAADMGIDSRKSDGNYPAPIDLIRTKVIIAAAAAGVPAIDTVYPDTKNDEGFIKEANVAAIDGFSGKLCIHPNQLELAKTAFTPSEERINWAQNVVSAFENAPNSGVLTLNGKMIDKPHLLLATRILQSL